MQYLNLILALFASWLCVATVALAAPVTVLVIDGPVDSRHPLIAPYYDHHTMASLVFRDPAYQSSNNWNQLNEGLMVLRTDRVPHWKRDLLAKYTQAIALRGLGFPQLSFSEIENERRVIAKVEENSQLHQELSIHLAPWNSMRHGMAVTGLITQGLPPSKLKTIHFPDSFLWLQNGKIQVPPLSTDGKLPQPLLDHIRPVLKAERQVFSQISAAIREANVKVVNLSIGNDLEGEYRAISSHFGPEWAKRDPEGILAMATTLAGNTFKQFMELIRNHPDTVFVIAAGNERSFVFNFEYGLADLKGKNVVIVGAVDGEGQLAAYSNRNSSRITVSAPVIAMNSAQPGGGLAIAGAGTSFAAPQVSRRIAVLRADHPEWSAAEAVQRFYDEHTVKSRELKWAVQEGRVLPLDARIDAPRGRGVFASPVEECEGFWQEIR